MSGTAERIRIIIREKNLVQHRVAEAAGFTGQQLCDMLRGRKLILADYLPRLAAALGVESRELLPDGMETRILSSAYERLTVTELDTGKEIAVVTADTVTTAADNIVVRLLPRGD